MSMTYAVPDLENQAARRSIATWYTELRRVQRSEAAARATRAAGATLLLAAVAVGLFLTVARPASEILWLQASGLLALAGVLITPVAAARRTYLYHRRVFLARKLYDKGLRVDRSGRLVTDEAHPRVVLNDAAAAGHPASP